MVAAVSNQASHSQSAREVATRLAETHDPAWIRAVVAELELKLQTTPLDRLISLWALSAAEAAQLFGVTRQAFAKWQHSGPPPDRSPAVAALAAATDLLQQHVKRERIAAVVRRSSEFLGNKSLIQLAREGKYREVHKAVRDMFDLRRVQP